MPQLPFPALGFGLGLRPKHYSHIFERKPPVDWFEIISENFMDTDGGPKRNLARIREIYPIVMHGVSLSIGTVDPLNSEYLRKLKALIEWIKPAWVSDHLCWTGIAHKNTHDLLPVPYADESLKHIVERIKQVQDFLERPLTIENPSTYLEFNGTTMGEDEFLARMANEANCNLLLDVNNVYVTCYNHHLDPKAYIDTLPLDRVIQIHLAGHSNKGHYILDTHDDQVVDEVWNLYKYVVHKAGRIPNTMVEWDDKIPEFPELYAELQKAQKAAADASNYVIPTLPHEQRLGPANEVASLSKSQTLMQSAIILGNDFDSRPDEWIKTKTWFSSNEQLGIYVNAYRYRLNDVTAEDYPVLQAYLGNEAFYKLIWDFANSEQSDHFNIARFATKLQKFIAMRRPEDILAQEICLLETALSQLADAKETPPLKAHHIEGMTADKLMHSTLYPRQAFQLFAFSYPVNTFYCDVMEGKTPSPPAPQPCYVAVFRHDDSMWRMDLDKMEYQLLQKLFSGMSVGEALEEMDESIIPEISSWFARWMQRGLLAAYDYSLPLTQEEDVSHGIA